MKKTINSLIIILLVSVFFLSGCLKKGTGDPDISFRTRKSRMVGEWRLKSGSAGFTFAKAGSPTISQGFVFDGSSAKMSETTTSGTPTIYIFAYSIHLSVLKDGTFVLTENYGSYTLNASGIWNFTSGIGKAKNKDAVVFIINNVDAGETSGHVFNKQTTEFTYKITELKNKELILEAGTSEYLKSNGEEVSYSGSFILKQ